MLQIGSIILRERKKLQVTQDTLAAYCNVSKASVSKWEKGQSYPDITLLPKIAAYFNLTVDDLLGYERRLTKEEIKQQYKQYAARFGKEPFEGVFADIEEEIKTYYNDSAFLLQMSVLMLNHHMLSDRSEEILKRTDHWLERIRQLSDDVWILRQSNSLQGHIALLQADPQKALDLLDGVIKPSIGDEMLLASAYEQLQDTTKAKRVIQVMIYQSILQIVGSSPHYLQLVSADEKAFTETIRRTNGLIELYALRELHPNICLQFYYGVAQCAASAGDRELMYDYLDRFVEVCVRYLFPIKLKGDGYFDLLEEWLEELDLGSNALRDESIVKQSAYASLEAPFFAAYTEEEEMKDLRKRLRWGLEEVK